MSFSPKNSGTKTPREEQLDCLSTDENYLGSIFISNIEAASNLRTLKKHDIKAVISVARGTFLEHSKQDLPNYLYLPADDNQQFDIEQFFEKTNIFIEKNRRKTNVLIHCVHGVSRSATIILAYLLRRYRNGLSQTLSQIKKIRPKIKPNVGFLQALRKYENQHILHQQTSFKSPQIFNRLQINTVLTLSDKSPQICISHRKEYNNDPESESTRKLQNIMQKLRQENDDILIRLANLKKKCSENKEKPKTHGKNNTTGQYLRKKRLVSQISPLRLNFGEESSSNRKETNPQNRSDF